MRAAAAILISDKRDIRAKKITIDKEGHYVIIKGSISQENITTLNVYVSKNRDSNVQKHPWRK